MVFVPSSFLVGVVSSTFATFILLEKVRDRRLAFDPKIDEAELNRYVYNSILYDRMRRVKEDQMMESDLEKKTREFVKENIVSNVNTGVNSVFGSSPVVSVRKYLGI